MPTALATLLSGVFLLGPSYQPGFSDAEVADIYTAALRGEQRQDPPRQVALNPHLMTDAGMYADAGVMPASVVGRLRAQGLFSELCGEGPSDVTGPRCTTQRAIVELRLSRPLRRGADAVDVYIGGGSVRPVGDTTSVILEAGGTMRCRIEREQARWVRRACVQTMIV